MTVTYIEGGKLPPAASLLTMQVKTLMHNLELMDLIKADDELAEHLSQGWQVLSIGFTHMNNNAYGAGQAYRIITLQRPEPITPKFNPQHVTLIESRAISRNGKNNLLYLRQYKSLAADEDLDEYQFNGWEVSIINEDGDLRFVTLSRPVDFKEGKSE